MMTNLAQHTDIRVALVVGGLSLNVQAATLRTSPEIVVATPVMHPAPSPSPHDGHGHTSRCGPPFWI